jgi:hypothetical protein
MFDYLSNLGKSIGNVVDKISSGDISGAVSEVGSLAVDTVIAVGSTAIDAGMYVVENHEAILEKLGDAAEKQRNK